MLFERGWPDGGYGRLRQFPELAAWLEAGYRLAESGDGFRVYAARGAGGRMRREVIARVIAAYDDPIIRAYAWGRFLILRQRFLDEIGQYLPDEGRILDIGCGFGLFSLYYAQLFPGYKAIRPGGRLVVKDVDTRPSYKRWFTHALDALMSPRGVIHYWPAAELQALLQRIGFRVYRHLMVDVLPYPHVLFVCQRD